MKGKSELEQKLQSGGVRKGELLQALNTWRAVSHRHTEGFQRLWRRIEGQGLEPTKHMNPPWEKSPPLFPGSYIGGKLSSVETRMLKLATRKPCLNVKLKMSCGPSGFP